MFRRFRVWMIAAVLAAGLTGLLRADTSRNIPVTTAPGLTDITLSLAGTGVIKNQIFWNTSGAPSTCTIQVDSSADSITWTAGGAVGAQTCTSSGASAVVTGTFNYIRTVITMTGSGSVVSIWSGYGTGGGGGGGGSITLQVNGVNNASQSQLNQTNTPTFNFVDLGTGSVTGAVNQTANYTWTGTHNFGNSAYFKGPSPWLSFKGFGAVGRGNGRHGGYSVGAYRGGGVSVRFA